MKTLLIYFPPFYAEEEKGKEDVEEESNEEERDEKAKEKEVKRSSRTTDNAPHKGALFFYARVL